MTFNLTRKAALMNKNCESFKTNIKKKFILNFIVIFIQFCFRPKWLKEILAFGCTTILKQNFLFSQIHYLFIYESEARFFFFYTISIIYKVTKRMEYYIYGIFGNKNIIFLIKIFDALKINKILFTTPANLEAECLCHSIYKIKK